MVCWCCLNVHRVPFTTIPQCSQVVVGTSLTQLAGLSPTSSLRDGSMPLPRFWSLGGGNACGCPAPQSGCLGGLGTLGRNLRCFFLILPPMWTGTLYNNCHHPLLSFGIKRSGMRITHSDGEHLVVLSDAEASALIDATALLVVASQSVAGAALPPRMATVLGQLFDGLKVSTALPAPWQDA